MNQEPEQNLQNMKKNIGFRVGIFGVISITVLILGYYFLNDVKILQSEFLLKARYDNVNGLSVGNPVFMNGFRIGRVEDLEIDRKLGFIIAVFSVEKDFNIPLDSKVMIYDLDLLGTKALKIILERPHLLRRITNFLKEELINL